MIHDHPNSDFLVARSMLPNPEQIQSHSVAMVNSEFALLKAKSSVGNDAIAWTCAM